MYFMMIPTSKINILIRQEYKNNKNVDFYLNDKEKDYFTRYR